MRESDYYAKASRYYTKHAIELGQSLAYDVKFTRRPSIAFSCLMPHQEEALLQAERSLAHKIPDAGVMKKPCDTLVVYGAFSFLLVVFYSPRDAQIYEIPIRAFIAERERCALENRKSLTHERAHIIGRRVTLL